MVALGFALSWQWSSASKDEPPQTVLGSRLAYIGIEVVVFDKEVHCRRSTGHGQFLLQTSPLKTGDEFGGKVTSLSRRMS